MHDEGLQGGLSPRSDVPDEDNQTQLGADQEQQSLAHAVNARRSEFTRSRRLRIKIGSWNVAAFKGTDKDIAGWFISGKGIAGDQEDANILAKGSGLTLEDAAPKDIESVPEQEARQSNKSSTIPVNDPGSLPGDGDVDIYALGLQEIVDVTSAAEALRPYTDPAAANKYKDALHASLPEGYVLVAEQQLIGLLLLIYASPDVAGDISSISVTSVGTGLMGYMGNKGAVTTRIVIGDTTRIVFVNCHLAAGAEASSLDRRNWDVAQIMSRTRFEPVADAAGMVHAKEERLGDEDFAFWFGDLNYRLAGMPGDDIRRILTLHLRNEYDIKPARTDTLHEDSSLSEHLERTSISGPGSDHVDSSAATAEHDERTEEDELDPASLRATIASLMSHDELNEQMKKRKSFHDGWREGEIHFVPTYKYDVGSVGTFDSSEKKRCPSWCDRILWRTKRDRLAYERRVAEEIASKQRDEQLHERGVDEANDDEQVLFDYNPELDGGDDYDDFADTEEVPETRKEEESEDELTLDAYTSHQRVLSSDHKPLTALFSVKCDVVIPEMRRKVHQEVARNLDRAENEGKPTVTVIVDRGTNNGENASEEANAKFEGIDFGNVRFGQSKRRALTIANTGQVPATISFTERPSEADQHEDPMPAWLTAKFDRDSDSEMPAGKTRQTTDDGVSQKYTLQPGDATTVVFTLRVDLMDLVKNLNNRLAALEDILVLRVDDGRDHFVPVRAQWLQSALTSSIEKLIRIPEGGIRRLQHQKPNSNTGHRTRASANGEPPELPRGNVEGDAAEPGMLGPSASLQPTKSAPASTQAVSPDTSTVKWSAPRELFRLTEALENLAQRVVAEWDMSHVSPTLLAGESFSQSLSPMSPRPMSAEPAANPLGRASVDTRVDTSIVEKRKAPWEAQMEWPFGEEGRSPWETDARKAALYAIYEALDTDVAFDKLIDENTPLLARLDATADALVTFLSSLDQGVVTESLWWQLEADAVMRKSQKVTLSKEEEKSRVLEVLTGSPAHNISFVLVTSMLSRLIAELTASDRAMSVPVSPSGNHARTPSLQADGKGSIRMGLNALRRRTLSKAAEEADSHDRAEEAVQTRRITRRKAYTALFAKALIRTPTGEGIKEKEKKQRLERSEDIVGLFLNDES